MKKYENPSITVLVFETQDVITVSDIYQVGTLADWGYGVAVMGYEE